MGLLHFARRKAGRGRAGGRDWAGRLDSTNVVRPALSVITTISFDHTRQLGSTLGAIATEKAGILKRGRPAVSGVRAPRPRLRSRAWPVSVACPLARAGRRFPVRFRAPAPPVDAPDPGPGVGPDLADRLGHARPPAARRPPGAQRRGRAGEPRRPGRARDRRRPGRRGRGASPPLRWPARVEVLGESPWLVIDGAHNVASAEALAETLRTVLPAVSADARLRHDEGQRPARAACGRCCRCFDTLVVDPICREPALRPARRDRGGGRRDRRPHGLDRGRPAPRRWRWRGR